MLHKEILQVPSKKAVYPGIFQTKAWGASMLLKAKKEHHERRRGVKEGGMEKGSASQNPYLKTHWSHLVSD